MIEMLFGREMPPSTQVAAPLWLLYRMGVKPLAFSPVSGTALEVIVLDKQKWPQQLRDNIFLAVICQLKLVDTETDMESTALKCSCFVKHLYQRIWVSLVCYEVLKERRAFLLLNVCVEFFVLRHGRMLLAAGRSCSECIYYPCHILRNAEQASQVCFLLPHSSWNLSHPVGKLPTKPSWGSWRKQNSKRSKFWVLAHLAQYIR